MQAVKAQARLCGRADSAEPLLVACLTYQNTSCSGSYLSRQHNALTGPARMCSLILSFVDMNDIKTVSLVNIFSLSLCNYETINYHFNAIFVEIYQTYTLAWFGSKRHTAKPV